MGSRYCLYSKPEKYCSNYIAVPDASFIGAIIWHVRVLQYNDSKWTSSLALWRVVHLFKENGLKALWVNIV